MDCRTTSAYKFRTKIGFKNMMSVNKRTISADENNELI